MARKPTSVRLSDEGWQILQTLMRYHGLNVTSAIEFALRVAARDAGILPAAPENGGKPSDKQS